mgnify:CR=1 FL=1
MTECGQVVEEHDMLKFQSRYSHKRSQALQLTNKNILATINMTKAAQKDEELVTKPSSLFLGEQL